MYSLDQDWSSTVILFMMVFLFCFFLGPTADGVSLSFRRSSASLNPGRLRLKGPERNVLLHVAFPGWQEVRTPTEEILLFVIMLKIEGKWKKRKEKRERQQQLWCLHRLQTETRPSSILRNAGGLCYGVSYIRRTRRETENRCRQAHSESSGNPLTLHGSLCVSTRRFTF